MIFEQNLHSAWRSQNVSKLNNQLLAIIDEFHHHSFVSPISEITVMSTNGIFRVSNGKLSNFNTNFTNFKSEFFEFQLKFYGIHLKWSRDRCDIDFSNLDGRRQNYKISFKFGSPTMKNIHKINFCERPSFPVYFIV